MSAKCHNTDTKSSYYYILIFCSFKVVLLSNLNPTSDLADIKPTMDFNANGKLTFVQCWGQTSFVTLMSSAHWVVKNNNNYGICCM